MVDVGGSISMVMYLGTATCKLKPFSATTFAFLHFAISSDVCLFQMSGFEHSNSIESPWWVRPGTVTGPAAAGAPAGAAGADVCGVKTGAGACCCIAGGAPKMSFCAGIGAAGVGAEAPKMSSGFAGAAGCDAAGVAPNMSNGFEP